MSELLPCPFCGSAGIFENARGSYGYYPQKLRVRCADEGCSGTTGWFQHGERASHEPPIAEAKATAAWNRRTPAPASDEAMEVLDLVCAALFPGGGKQDHQAAARIIQQYGDQREAAGKVVSEKMARAYEAAGFRRGVEAAAKYVQENYPHDKRTLVPGIRRLALLETQEAG